MAYSVLEAPVIPVLMKDGARTVVGIRDAFLLAHDIRDIQEITPLERYAILRMLIAFAMDMLHPKDSYARRDLWDQKKFDAVAFDRYVDLCEEDGPRFDLFDSNHPFLQSRYDETLDAKPTAKKSVATLFHALPSGNNHIFFDHRLENTQAVSFAEAFRALCACYLFCISNKSGPGSINNTPSLYAVIVGNNLFETLIINMLSEKEALPVSYGTGTVPWRNGKKVIPREEVPDVTLLQALTWMPRRITLIPEDHQTVREVYFQSGLNFRGNNRWKDPHVPYSRKKENILFSTIKPEFGRSIWRDVGSLLYDHDDGKVRPPQVVRCLENILENDEKPEWIPIRTSGLIVSGGRTAKYEDWCEEELRLPAVLLYDYILANQFRADIEAVENVQKILYSNVKKYVDNPRSESTDNKQDEIAQQCRQHFLNKAHDLLFGECLDEICKGIPEQEHADHFCDAVKKLLQDTLSDIMKKTGNSTKSLKKQMNAEKWIWKKFGTAVKKRKEGYA